MDHPEKILAGEKPGEQKPPEFKVWQAHIAHSLNISEEEVRRRRDTFLSAGIHFEKKGRRIFFSQEGVKRLRETLNVPLETTALAQDTAQPAPPEKKGAGTDATNPSVRKPLLLEWPVQIGEEVTLKVWRTAPFIKNKRLVEAYLVGRDPSIRENIVRVQVSSNVNFTIGMELPAKLQQKPDYYICTRRAPRSRGRW